MTDATTRPLRFCMITTFYPPYNFGGDGIAIQRLANELADRGHTVDVIHCENSYRALAPRGPVGAGDDHPGVTVHGLRSPLGLLSPLATHQTGRPLFKARRIREILDAGFDVIHFHNISLVGGPGILAYGRGVKLYTLHDYWAVCPTFVLLRFNRAPCERPYCIGTLTHLRPPQCWRYTGLLKRMARHVDAFIAPSRFIANKHRDMCFDAPIVHLPHFVPLPRRETAARSARPEPVPFFLFVGRLEKVKGLQTLIPLIRRHATARLLIAGAGTWETKLRRMAAGCDRIEFLGHKAMDELTDLYRRAVAVIVPTICFEKQGLVVIEALGLGTPAIMRRIGGMPELIEHGGGGMVYETDDELVAAMDRLLADASYRDEVGRRGRDTYERDWTPDIHIDRYLALINRISSRREAEDGVRAARTDKTTRHG